MVPGIVSGMVYSRVRQNRPSAPLELTVQIQMDMPKVHNDYIDRLELGSIFALKLIVLTMHRVQTTSTEAYTLLLLNFISECWKHSSLTPCGWGRKHDENVKLPARKLLLLPQVRADCHGQSQDYLPFGRGLHLYPFLVLSFHWFLTVKFSCWIGHV